MSGLSAAVSRARARLLPQSRLARATLMISGATVLAQLIGLAAAPVMTRLFSPDVYGSFFIANSIGLALSAGLALRLEQAIPLPANEDEVRNLVMVAFGAIAGLTLLTSIATAIVGAEHLGSLIGMPNERGGIWLIGPMAASFALFGIFNAVAIREARFGAIARRHLVLAVLTVGLQIAAGLSGAGLIGLCLATATAQVGGALSMLIGSPFFAGGLRRGGVISRTLRRYRRFPLVLAPSGWLNSLGSNAPLVAVGAVFSSEVAGWFGLTLRVVAVPATFVGTALANVYVSELARRHREGTGAQVELFYRVSKNLFWAAVVFGLVLAVGAPIVFTLMFGPDWRPTGDMAQAYAVAAAAGMIASPVSGTLTVHEHVYQQIIWDAARLLTTVGSVLIAYKAGADALQVIWVLSAATALLYAVNWEMCRRSVLNQGAP